MGKSQSKYTSGIDSIVRSNPSPVSRVDRWLEVDMMRSTISKKN